jgi:hypothetical protein
MIAKSQKPGFIAVTLQYGVSVVRETVNSTYSETISSTQFCLSRKTTSTSHTYTQLHLTDSMNKGI